jgi:hypothetical protein
VRSALDLSLDLTMVQKRTDPKLHRLAHIQCVGH